MTGGIANIAFKFRNRLPHLVHIGMPVIDRGDSAEGAGGVVKNFLRHMDRCTECGQR